MFRNHLYGLLGALALSACSSEAGQATAPLEGEIAPKYPEVVRLDDQAQNVGVGILVSPQVVLTVGHVAELMNPAVVSALNAPREPYHGNPVLAERPSRLGADKNLLEWGNETCGTHCPDLSVILLPKPIRLPAYPKLAIAPLNGGDEVLVIGRRIQGYDVIPSAGFVTATGPVQLVQSASSFYSGFFDASPGDSGSPAFDVRTLDGERTVVGLLAARQRKSGEPLDFIQRVDVLSARIQQLVERVDGRRDRWSETRPVADACHFGDAEVPVGGQEVVLCHRCTCTASPQEDHATWVCDEGAACVEEELAEPPIASHPAGDP